MTRLEANYFASSCVQENYGTYTSMPLVSSPTSMTSSGSPCDAPRPRASGSYVSLASLTDGALPASPPPSPPLGGDGAAPTRPSPWGGFFCANLAARRGHSAPELPRIYVTPPTPSAQAREAGEPWQQVSAQVYIGTCVGVGTLAATGLVLEGSPRPYVALGMAALVAGSVGLTQVRGLQGPLRHASRLQWPLAAAHGAALGAALVPVRRAIALGEPPVLPSLLAATFASALGLGTACGDWRALAASLRGHGATDALGGMPVEVWSFATVACGTLALLAGGTGVLVDDDALTGIGCAALLGVPAALAAWLATGP